MSRVRSKGTSPEVFIRKALWHAGFRYRIKSKLPGKPDIVFNKLKVVIFVHGCFWHCHGGCPKSKLPSTRKEFWADKIVTNVKRDEKNITKLKEQGWRVAIIWECSLKNQKSQEQTVNSLKKWIVSNSDRIEMQGSYGG